MASLLDLLRTRGERGTGVIPLPDFKRGPSNTLVRRGSAEAGMGVAEAVGRAIQALRNPIPANPAPTYVPLPGGKSSGVSIADAIRSGVETEVAGARKRIGVTPPPDPSMIEGGSLNTFDLQELARQYKRAERREELRGTTEPAPRGDNAPLGRRGGMALTELGLRLAASRRPDTLGALGEAGLGALKSYQAAEAAAAAQNLEARKVAAQEALGTAQASHFRALAAQASQKSVKNVEQDREGQFVVVFDDGTTQETGIQGIPNDPIAQTAVAAAMKEMTFGDREEVLGNLLATLHALSTRPTFNAQGERITNDR